MKPTLHILTTCFRIENLETIALHIRSQPNLFDIFWHITFDGTKVSRDAIVQYRHILELSFVRNDWFDQWSASKAPTSDGTFSPCAEAHNRHLEQIASGWVFIHDDDTILHPEFLLHLRENINCYPQYRGWLFSIEDRQWKRLCEPKYVRVGHIDLGQYVLDRALIGTTRYTTRYGFDGIFMEEIYNRNPGLVGIDPRFLILHNWLRQ